MSDLLLTLSVPRQQYAIGEEVDLTVEIRNQSSKPILIPNPNSGGAPGPIYIIKLPNGKAVTYDPLGPDADIRTKQDLPIYLVTVLGPGEKVRDSILPKWGAPLDQPGKYAVTARLKWREYELESETVEFTLVANRLSNMVQSEFPKDPERPPLAERDYLETWEKEGDTAIAQIAVDNSGNSLIVAHSCWYSPDEPMDSQVIEWPIDFGQDIRVKEEKIPVGARLIPVQTAGEPGTPRTSNRLVWIKDELRCGWLKKHDEFYWFSIPSPKPIFSGLRLLDNLFSTIEEADAFVIFQGEAAELGHARITDYEKDPLKHTPLRPIAELGPGLVAAQVMLGPPEIGSPIVLVSLNTHPTGTQVTFLRIDGKQGTVVGKSQHLLAGWKPLGPVAMTMRIRGAQVEAAFPVQDQNTNDLHVIRLTTTVALESIQKPIVSDPIKIEGPTPSMVIAYSNFPHFFPNGVGLLLRQPGNRAFFWTAVRGLKQLPFTLRDKDEALIMGRRSSWYVLVNDGARMFAKTAESFYEEYRPPIDLEKLERDSRM